MKTIRRAGFAALLGIGLFGALPAHAQINGAAETTEQSNTDPDSILSKGYRSNVILGYSPVASFASAGSFANGIQGTQTDIGQLFEGDFVVRARHSQGHVINRVGLGGWYWTKGSGDLYQIHGRAFISDQFGIQAAYLSSTSHIAPGPSYTLFLIYQLDSHHLRGAQGNRKPFGIEFGLGTYIDPTNFPNNNTALQGHRLTTLGFSTYINGSLDLGKRFSINASQWYIRDRTADLTRFTLGVGYHF